jgi:hypothetical protein
MAPLLIALVAVALPGCGSASSSTSRVGSAAPAQIVAAARAAALGAATVHVSGSIAHEGKSISLDLELESGKGGKGTVVTEGLAIKLIQIDGTVYVNGSGAFYRQVAGATAARALRGKWLKAPGSAGNFSSLASLTNLDNLVATTLEAHGTLSRAGTMTVGGEPAVGVRDRGKGGTLYVASTGSPFPLEIVEGGSGGKIVFDRWNEAVTLEAPVGAININQLRSGS